MYTHTHTLTHTHTHTHSQTHAHSHKHMCTRTHTHTHTCTYTHTHTHTQINIPQELVGYILDCMSQGLITRGLFHEAALNIFSVLILYWKKFCLVRFAPKRQRSATNSDEMKKQEWMHGGEEHREWHTFFGGIHNELVGHYYCEIKMYGN